MSIQIDIASVKEYFKEIVDSDGNGKLSAGDVVAVTMAGPGGKTSVVNAVLGADDFVSVESLAKKLSLLSSNSSAWQATDDDRVNLVFKDRSFTILNSAAGGQKYSYLAVSEPAYWTGKIFGKKPRLERVIKIGMRENQKPYSSTDLVDQDVAPTTKLKIQWVFRRSKR